MNSKLRKNLLNALFLFALLSITVWAVFKDQDLGHIIDTLAGVAPIYLVIGFVLVILYVCSESVIIKYLLAIVQIRVPLINCIRYSFVGFFTAASPPPQPGDSQCRFFI